MSMPGATHTQEELEALSRDDLKALADGMGLEYAPTAHNSTIINLILESEGEPDMAEEQAAAEDAAPEEPAVEITETGTTATEVVDPYKQVFSPWELPANTAAAAAISTQVTVDENAPISDERIAQATAAIQEHQDGVQEAVSQVSDDPRLSGSTFAEQAAKQAEEAAAREEEKAKAAEEDAQVAAEKEEAKV